MKASLLSFSALAAVVAVPAVVQAQDSGSWAARNGVYGSVKGGWTQPRDQEFDNIATEAKLDDGWTGSAAVGVTRGNWRGEVEALHQEADVDSVNSGGVTTNSGGDTKLTAGMVNGYYDFNNTSYWTPYVGAGVGYGKVKFSGYNPAGGANAIDDDDDVMAYQGMAGVAYEFNPCWTFTGEYRYVGTTDADVRTAGGTNTSANYESHNVMAGLRYTF